MECKIHEWKIFTAMDICVPFKTCFVADSSAVFSANEIFKITMFDQNKWNFHILGLSLNTCKAC